MTKDNTRSAESRTLTLGGNNTYTGTTTILGGVLAESATGFLADTSPLIVDGPSSVFNLGNNHNDTVGTVTLRNGGSIVGTGTSKLTTTGTFEFYEGTVSVNLGGIGVPLNKILPADVVLSGANTYTGVTTIEGSIRAANIAVTNGASNLGNATTPVVLGGAILPRFFKLYWKQCDLYSRF